MLSTELNWNIWLDTVLPLFIAFALTVVSGKFLIPFLTRIKAGQTERDDGPKSHLSKTGTPNMGGLMIMLGFIIACIVSAVRNPQIIPIVILTVGFAVVGFVDDYIKVILKRSKGLLAWQKLLLQIVIVLFFVWYMQHFHNIALAMKIPFVSGKFIDLGILNIPFMLFVIVATVNGTNLNDGVDGMASCVTIAVTLFFTAAAIITASGAAPAGAAMIGALLGFLIYNAYPARIFMGDTGSLALGGFVAGMAYMMQMPLYIPIVGFIYLLEAVSVILQVLYFKKTKGKRLFRMAPIHHHFELGGYSEVRVVALFTIITVLIAVFMLPFIW
ncbi:MAG: phospho-N-acetylmuramoyl-pentapeptide-transferase [Lachnospiraceae bacterium]|nr:phospho-N-acetylmuramoyl-pentapeptide-transferase [Lachnospiraceae bacterium]